jgi:hypothetical protein
MTKLQGAAAKGRGPGRPKGARNKITRNIQEAITEAFEKAGGAKYLERIAHDDPKTFCALLGKVLPMQVDASVTGRLVVVIEDPTVDGPGS